ncbi:hypothetical protein AWF53_26540 [Escherichia coli]|nr:hypothetical protein AWF53_26540 [Escherichia coli]
MLLAHISDTHFRSRGEKLYGFIDVNAANADVVSQLNALRERPDAVVVMFSSCSQIWPSLTGSSPASRRSRVLFPQPDGPTSTTNSPSWISSDRALSAGLPSKRLLMFCRLSMAVSALPLGN